ncbi:hypothetical protein GH733_002414 [Mirounga leonina]|nr:hypothetical protein GH733_002414 [Mirounga leonina]
MEPAERNRTALPAKSRVATRGVTATAEKRMAGEGDFCGGSAMLRLHSDQKCGAGALIRGQVKESVSALSKMAQPRMRSAEGVITMLFPVINPVLVFDQYLSLFATKALPKFKAKANLPPPSASPRVVLPGFFTKLLQLFTEKALSSVVLWGIVFGSILLAYDELLRVEELAVGANVNFINDHWFQVYKHCPRHMLASTCLTEEGCYAKNFGPKGLAMATEQESLLMLSKGDNKLERHDRLEEPADVHHPNGEERHLIATMTTFPFQRTEMGEETKPLASAVACSAL